MTKCLHFCRFLGAFVEAAVRRAPARKSTVCFVNAPACGPGGEKGPPRKRGPFGV